MTETSSAMDCDKETLSELVVLQVAQAEGIDPEVLEPPLYDVIDPDALDHLFASPSGGPDRSVGRVIFEFHNYEIIAVADGEVTLRELS